MPIVFWFLTVFVLGVGVGIWIAFAYMSWRTERLKHLKKQAKGKGFRR